MNLHEMLLASKLGGVGGVNLHEMLIAQKLFGGGGGGSGGGGGESASYTYSKIIDRSISGTYTNATVTSLGMYALFGCANLTAVNFPAVTKIGAAAFQQCKNLTTADFSAATSIEGYAFASCSSLATLILRGQSMCVLTGLYSFSNTPIQSGTGYIYVPAALVDSYKAAYKWQSFNFRAIEDYPEITGGES